MTLILELIFTDRNIVKISIFLDAGRNNKKNLWETGGGQRRLGGSIISSFLFLILLL